jgi:hypothetical protein
MATFRERERERERKREGDRERGRRREKERERERKREGDRERPDPHCKLKWTKVDSFVGLFIILEIFPSKADADSTTIM